jgi:hypothetical protein
MLNHYLHRLIYKYPNVGVIIDCTEIFTERPSLALASTTFSPYKSHNTWKGFVGISPHGAVTFIGAPHVSLKTQFVCCLVYVMM